MDSAFLLDQLRREQGDDPWHGPSMAVVLDAVDAAAALARPLDGAHSIWEIVLHLTSWSREVARRLRTGVARDPEDGDWPPAPEVADPSAWNDARLRLRRAQDDLRAAIKDLPPAQWNHMLDDVRDPAMGTGVTHREMLYGVLQHETYHTGQMVLLAKAGGARAR